MLITFILGNGFDIQMGLHTRYKDFIENYIKPDVNDDSNIKEFKRYLQSKENIQLWSDAEIGMGTHLGDFSDENFQMFTSRIRDFELKMRTYLLQQQNLVSYEETEKIKKIMYDFIFSSYKDVLDSRFRDIAPSLDSNHNYRFISFNYTNVIDNLLACTAQSNGHLRTRRTAAGYSREDNYIPPLHVHGTLDTQIIMGVNDESQLNLTGGVSLNKYVQWALVKSAQNAETNNNWDKPAKDVIQKSDIIYIYGVSYGETDALWWTEIRNWLKSNSQHRLVAFFRSTSSDLYDESLPWMVRMYDDMKRTEILVKLGFKQDDPAFESLLDQVYIIRDTKRLDLKEVLQQKKELAIVF